MSIVIRPIEAALIHDTDWICRMDPYCKIYLGGQCQQTTICHNGGKTPRWGETFCFNTMDQNMRVQIWDYDTIGNDQLIGAGSINVDMSMFQGGNSIWIDLFYNGRTAGRVCVSAQFGNGGMNQMGGMGMGMGMNQGMMGGMGMNQGMMGGMGINQGYGGGYDQGFNQGYNQGGYNPNNPLNNVGWSNYGQPGGYNNGGW